MKDSEQERKDWYLLLLFLPLAILLMFFAGQKAIQLLPRWNLNADIRSNLDPNRGQSGSGIGPLAPLRPEILTPPSWNDTFLTPSADQASATQPTFVAFNPSATASASPTPQPTGTIQATTTSTVTTTVTATATRTRRPRDDTSPTLPAPTLAYTPTNVVSPVPAEVNVGPGDSTSSSGFYNLADNSSLIIDVSTNPIVVNGPSDTGYDLVYYERPADNPPTYIAMDSVIVGISQDSNGNPTYPVLNWGDGVSDTNTNVDTSLAGIPPEADNAPISTTGGVLYGTPPDQTGVAIDVDNAPSHPPPGTYNYVVISAPDTSIGDNNDGADVDAVQVLP